MLHYSYILSLQTCKILFHFYINIFKDLILTESSQYLDYINDLIEGIIQFPYKINEDDNNNIFNFIINLFEEYFVKNLDMKMKINKSYIWQKLLRNKMISNNEEKQGMKLLTKFLVNIYKYNIDINFLFDNIYKYSATDLNYYINSLHFLSELFKTEEKRKKDFTNFHIKCGFYIPKNNPLILENIKFKENEFSLIFSFRIIKSEKNAKQGKENEEEIILFNLSNNVHGNVVIRFIINKNKTVTIIYGNTKWALDKITIRDNKDYLVCLTQSYTSKKNKKLFFFINNVDKDKKELNTKANNKNNSKINKNVIEYDTFSSKSSYPYFESEMILELGKKNFNGIFGDFLIINKKLEENNISNLFNLNGYYYLLGNINDQYDLINKLDNFYSENSDNIKAFKDSKFKCILKILSFKLNNAFAKNYRELKVENFGILKHKDNNQIIKVVDLMYSIDFFYNKNGLEFLLFQLHNIFNNTNDDDNKSSKPKKESLKFSYFILSLLIILYNNKNQGINIQLDNKIYDLLLKYSEFYNIHNYYTHRNVILSILLDDTFFDQKTLVKSRNILLHLLTIINELNSDKVNINKELLLKILNLDFIFTSKEYHHKLYIKIILSLLLNKDNRMFHETIIKTIIHIKNEIKLYHYLKCIYINFDALKNILLNEPKLITFLKKYPKKELYYFHCKYCFNSLFLIYQIKQELIKDEEKSNDKKNDLKQNTNIINSIQDRDFFFKYIESFIKCKYINFYKISNEKKLMFIKNKCLLSNGDNKKNINKKKDNKDNKDKDIILYIESNIMDNYNFNIILLNFDSIVNDLFTINNIYYENLKNKLKKNGNNINSDENNEEKEIIDYIFNIIKNFWEELLNYYNTKKTKISQDQISFLNKLLSLKGTETFFRMYLMHDYNSALNFLHSIIELSIDKIKHPFYFNYIEIDENIDKDDKENNDKIKNEITKFIILKINENNDIIEDIINYNRGLLIIIMNDIIKNKVKLSTEIEKYFIMYLKGLSENKFFYNKSLFKSKAGEYSNLLEIALNILFDIYKASNFSENYNKIINEFIIVKKKSVFSLIDEESIKGNQINNKKEDYLNILYTIYFLIYFIEKEKDFIDNNIQIHIDGKKSSDINPIVFIQKIINTTFNNSKEIYKLKINSKKSFRYNNQKFNNENLESYHALYNYYSLNINKSFELEDIEKCYNEKKNSFSKTRSINFRESKNRNKDFDRNISFDKTDASEKIFVVKLYNDDNTNEKKEDIPIQIIDDYIPKNENNNENNKEINNQKDNDLNMKKFHNSISSFRRKKEISYDSSKFLNEKEKENKNKDNKNDEGINKNKDNINENKEGYNNENVNENNKKEEININNEIKKEEKESNEEITKCVINDDTNTNDKNIINEEIKNNEVEDEKTIKTSEITSLKEVSKTENNNSQNNNTETNENNLRSYTRINLEDDSNNNINLHKEKDLSNLINEINIPMVYYKQLINYTQLYYTKMLANPKINYIWKIFTYSFRDILFNNKNFIKVSKSFEVFSQNYKLEMSSEEEKKYRLHYPTKIKNFICNDYYRPFLKPDLKFFNRQSLTISHSYLPIKAIERIKLEDKFSRLKFVKFCPINESEKELKRFYCENVSYKGSIFGKMFLMDSFMVFVNMSFSNIKKCVETIRFFLYSKEDTKKYKNINKVILFYYNEIKEIIARRFCLKYIGYEIFLKDGRSYLFNFFTPDKFSDFTNSISSKNKEILINEPIF